MISIHGRLHFRHREEGLLNNNIWYIDFETIIYLVKFFFSKPEVKCNKYKKERMRKESIGKS